MYWAGNDINVLNDIGYTYTVITYINEKFLSNISSWDI